MMRRGLLGCTLLLIASPALTGSATSPPERDGAWIGVSRDASESRNSAATQITPENVGRLRPVWFADLSDIGQRAFEATPIVVDGRMFVSESYGVVLAFDAASGRELWRFDPGVAKDYTRKGCCGPANRGVAYAAGRIFVGAYDGRLIALDAATGKQVWSTLTFDQSKDYTITGAPRIVGTNVLIGNGGAELGVRGYVSAYDIASGRLAWRFYTVPPRPGTKDGAASDAVWARVGATWSGEWWKLGGGGTVWDSMAYDPTLDLVYVGVGNGAPWNRRMRSAGRGDNLFLSSILALHAKTGEYAWHFQTTPGEEWDYTATQSIILADLTVGGRPRKVLMQAPKNGFFYLLDRTTGEFLSGRNYVAQNWATELDPKGRPLELATARYSENDRPSPQQPGPLGGHNWHSMSFDAASGLAFIPAIEAGYNYVPAGKGYAFHPATPNMGVDPVATALPRDAAARDAIRASAHGELIAWDVAKGQAAWRVRHDVAWNGGALSTASGLVFQGLADGDLVAYSAKDGRRLWSANLGAGIVAAPMTFMLRGRQYVAVAVGWGGSMPQVVGALTSAARSTGINRLVVLGLDGGATLPPVAPAPATASAPPPSVAPPATIAAGEAIYERRCYACHGSRVVSGGEVPDLRRSGAIADAAAFRAIVLEGALAEAGMPNFGHDLNAAQAEQLRAYIIARANER